MDEQENGLETDGRLVIEGIRAGVLFHEQLFHARIRFPSAMPCSILVWRGGTRRP